MRSARCARRATRAGLGAHVTLDACRHGGMTELGDAGATERGVMALSMHKTPQALRLYVKRTEAAARVLQPASGAHWSRRTDRERIVGMGRQTKSSE